MALLRLCLFGYPTITYDEAPLAVDDRKALGLLAYLAVTGERHSRAALSTLLWPDHDQPKAYANLRHALWALRQAGLEQALAVDSATIGLRPGYWLDIVAFRQALEADQIEAALELHRADFLAGFSLRNAPDFDDWQIAEAERLRQLLSETLQRQIAQQIARNEHEQALRYSQRWLHLDPLHEAAHRQLMQLYAAVGQRAAALRQYQLCAQLLRAELDATPEPATTALYTALQSGRFPQSPTIRESLATLTRPDHTPGTPEADDEPQLPRPPTPFIGRCRELAELHALLAQPGCRLLTLVGVGGMGKTRLAIELARRVRGAFADGVRFVALDVLSDPERMAEAILAALGRAIQPGDPRVQLLAALRDQQRLLVLDNFEQLLDGAELLSELLAAASGLKIVVTSREVLSVQEEWSYQLAGLELPADVSEAAIDENSAVQLFAERARRVQHRFSLAAERGAIVHICRLVEGMPLAIELAAAWTRTLPCATIAAEIARSLALLETSLRNVPERQRSIRRVFDYIWLRLSDAERAVLLRLALFHDGFDHQAAAQIADAAPALLAALVDKALLRRDCDGRYHVHALLQQYADWRLDTLQARAPVCASAHTSRCVDRAACAA